MQIVIDIPDYEYKNIKEYYEKNNIVEATYSYIYHGTPLPPHGRLIDADKIVAEATECMKYPANYKYMECVIAHMKLAPSIIEADKAESDEQERVDDYRDRLDELEREEYYESKYGKEKE